jgi:HSP20 family protein
VDIFENENELVIKADLPDVRSEDIDIQVENNTLTIRGQRRFEQQSEKGGYHRIERSYGSFVRTFTVPNTVETDKVAANYNHGVLTVNLPKKEAAKPRQVKVGVTTDAQSQPISAGHGSAAQVNKAGSAQA